MVADVRHCCRWVVWFFWMAAAQTCPSVIMQSVQRISITQFVRPRLARPLRRPRLTRRRRPSSRHPTACRIWRESVITASDHHRPDVVGRIAILAGSQPVTYRGTPRHPAEHYYHRWYHCSFAPHRTFNVIHCKVKWSTWREYIAVRHHRYGKLHAI